MKATSHFKIITIIWKDGGSTTMTVHSTTDVLTAYEPALQYIRRIVETDVKANKATVIYKSKE